MVPPILREDAVRMPRLVPRTLAGRLALILNATLVTVLAAFAAWELGTTADERLLAKRNSLRDEAEGLAEAISLFDPSDAAGIQRHIDAVCDRMRERSSPGHYILVETDRHVLEATQHVGHDPERARVVREVAGTDRFGRVGGRRMVAARAAEGGVTVYVAEKVSDIQREMRMSLVRRILAVTGAGIVLAVVVNAAVHVLVRQPVQHLQEAIQQVRHGELGTEARAGGVREMHDLVTEFNRMTQALAQAEADRQQRLDRAQRIQRKLFPRFERLGPYRIDGFHLAADAVAGDYWDFLECGEGSMLMCLADVSGHGVAAAMGATMLKVLVADAASCRRDPAEILAHVNGRFVDLVLEDDFATMLLVRFAADGSGFCYASAGHEAAVLVRRGEDLPILLSASGPPLGIDAATRWASQAFPFAAGDRLVAATDGVPEAVDPAGRPFGRDRLVEAIRRGRQAPIDQHIIALREQILAHLAGRPSNDDMTIVAVELAPPGREKQVSGVG